MIDVPHAVAPSDEVLSEAAKQVGRAYPDLFAHQRTGVTFLLARRRAILADSMGLGKSRTAIVAAREAAPDGPYLVVCPASLKLNWRREIRMVEPGATVQVVPEPDGWRPNARWTVVNYDLLGRHEADLLSTPWAGILVDEAHYVKNDSQRTARLLRMLGVGSGKAPVAEPEVIYLLTGTPMGNRPRDLFNLLKAVRHPLAASFHAYTTRYCAAFDNGYGLDTNGASNLGELAELVSGVMLRRTKDEALDLPPKLRTWQPVEVTSKEVARLEGRALDYLAKNPSRSGPTWISFLGLLNRARHALALAKVPATIEAIRERVEAGDKVVVFTSYTAVVDALRDAFGPALVSITGDDAMAERQGAADALQDDPSVRVLAGNLRAAGVGLNLTAAAHVVFNDLDWVPGNHWQAEDRIYRIGQTRTALVTYLYAPGTLDDFVAALLEAKARNIGVLEDEAARRASVLEDVLHALADGRRPRLTATEPDLTVSERSVGLLEQTLDLLARARRGLGAVTSAEQVVRVPSSSRRGQFHTVTVANGIARCSCEGFTYRGNCSHARGVAARLSAGHTA